MIILTEKNIKNNDEINTLIQKQREYINYISKSQHKFKKILLDYMQKFADSTDNVDIEQVDTILSYLEKLKIALNFSNENILLLKGLSESLNNFLLELKNDKIQLENFDNFNTKFIENNEIIMQNTIEIENFLYSVLPYTQLKFINNSSVVKANSLIGNQISSISDNTKINETESKSKTLENTITSSSTLNSVVSNKNQDSSLNDSNYNKTLNKNANIYTENTLIISETKGKIFLPYNLSELNKTLENNPDKYSCIDDIITQNFTLPFNLFKSPSISRFREAFKLMRNKEKSSVKSAFDLGMELLFNYNLHPAIISACRNLDELDIYLDYLENSQTDKFDCFKIIFDIAPVLSKK